jgi:hypothetical protein
MKKTTLNSIIIKNFKGIASYSFDFCERTEIVADVMQGKSSIKDAYFFALGLDIENFFPLGKDNKPIDGIETFVEIAVSVDGLDYTLSRGAKVKYKLNRETSEKTFDGFKKDIYAFDKVPCTANEYKSKVCSLLGVEDFNALKYISVLNYFNEQLSWKERRETLYNLFADKQAIEEIKKNDKYSLISNELLKGKSSSDISTMLNSENLSLVEAMRKNDILRADKRSYLDEIAFDEQLDYEEAISAIEGEIEREKARLDNLDTNKIRIEIQQKVSELNLERLQLEMADNTTKQNLLSTISKLEFEALHIKDIGLVAEHKISTHTQKYKDVKESVFMDTEKVCPTCGQEFPQSHLDKILVAWDTEKQQNLDFHKKEILKYKKQYEENKYKYVSITTKIDLAKKELESFEPNPRIDELKAEIFKLGKAVPSTDAIDKTTLNDLLARRNALVEGLGARKAYLACKEKLSQLNEEHKALVNAEILLAKKRAQLEQYTLDVINVVNNSINRNFDGIEFKLFDVLTSTAKKDIKETCVVMQNGIDYSSQSTGQKANTNCIIVSTLQSALGINTPIWLDDASVLNLTNEPSNQLIYLLNKKDERLNYSRIRDLY